MAPLPTFQLPLPSNGPPPGYGWEERDISVLSTTTPFKTGVDKRDTFLGKPHCIICGLTGFTILKRCYIIRDSEPDTWSDLKTRHWIPLEAKAHPRDDPRNGLLMCANHCLLFEAYEFFIRFLPDVQKFVFVNHSNAATLQGYHGKAIALDIKDRHAPFPATFIIHEMRARGVHPFATIEQMMPDDSPWQDWVLSEGVFDHSSGFFIRDGPPDDENDRVFVESQIQFQPGTITSPGDTTSGSSGRYKLALNADVIADILAVTRTMPSWKACEEEGMRG